MLGHICFGCNHVVLIFDRPPRDFYEHVTSMEMDCPKNILSCFTILFCPPIHAFMQVTFSFVQCSLEYIASQVFLSYTPSVLYYKSL
jgi:hypothetical protein